MSAMVSFPLSMGQKGSKIIQITLSLLMRSSAKCVLVFCRCAVVICRTGIEKEYLIFKKRLWKITSTFTLPQLSSPEILKGSEYLVFPRWTFPCWNHPKSKWELAGDRDFHIKVELERVAFSTFFFFVYFFSLMKRSGTVHVGTNQRE